MFINQQDGLLLFNFKRGKISKQQKQDFQKEYKLLIK
jgi:ligand-binding sensor domain-containing protein